MYRQKSVIFTIGKTLYIGWGKIQKKKEGFFYIYKKTPIISVSIIYIGKTLQSGQDIKEKKGSYIGKIPLYKEIYKKNTYMGLYKSSLPNLNYCYINRAARFCLVF